MKKVIVFFGLIFIIYGSVGAFADLSPSPEEQAYNDALWKRESEYCEAHGGMPKVMTNTDGPGKYWDYMGCIYPVESDLGKRLLIFTAFAVILIGGAILITRKKSKNKTGG